MKGYIHILFFFCLMLLVQNCQSKKHRNKPRDETQKARGKEDKLNVGEPYTKSLNDLIHQICLPTGYDRLVYRYKNNSHIFIGFDDVGHDTVHSMTWKINANNPEALTGNNPNRFKILPASEVRTRLKTEHLLAAADKKLQQKFKQNISTCGQSRVTSKACLIQSFAVLARKMKEVTFGKTCNK